MTKTDPHPQPVVLVAEDEELIRLWAADVLQENGFSVLEAANAEAALRVLEARPEVRLLFTDIHMPGAFDGMELARRVHDRWPHVQLVVTSSLARPRSRMTAASSPSPTGRSNSSGTFRTCCAIDVERSGALGA
jgi:two-component system, response regulator PdtaR